MCTPLLLQLCQYPATHLTGEDASRHVSAVVFLCFEHGLVPVTQYSTQEEICLNTVSIKFVYNDNQMLLLFASSSQRFRLTKHGWSRRKERICQRLWLQPPSQHKGALQRHKVLDAKPGSLSTMSCLSAQQAASALSSPICQVKLKLQVFRLEFCSISEPSDVQSIIKGKALHKFLQSFLSPILHHCQYFLAISYFYNSQNYFLIIASESFPPDSSLLTVFLVGQVILIIHTCWIIKSHRFFFCIYHCWSIDDSWSSFLRYNIGLGRYTGLWNLIGNTWCHHPYRGKGLQTITPCN